MSIQEPRILLTGRQKSTLEVLKEELTRYGRDIRISNDWEEMKVLIQSGSLDFMVIGGGLDDQARDEIVAKVDSLATGLPVHLMPRQPGANPAKVVPFVNELAVMHKVNAADSRTDREDRHT